MSFKSYSVAFFLGGTLMLSACSQEEPSQENEDTNKTMEENQTETSTDMTEEESHASSEEDTGDETNTNDEGSKDASERASEVEKQEYDSREDAAAAINGYMKVEQTNIDLGHGIKGMQEGAAGHEYISWNEGNWLIRIDFPNDPQYRIEGYEGGDELAKKVVDYLEDHYLPAPQDKGVITINGFKEHPETVVKWQKDKTVYTITSKEKEPFDALETAVESGGMEKR
ncbi:hypothetical protein FGG79_11890 [Bacillus sp. BHET2]|uniref:hypothetical protein n=1 Tax=Bacillus sp. BHET2 TaxID=2583818 RepID=UPI00110ED26F|nr:hypothetical protein [Bacillus sp. BHET2]TMU85888.1 hypothetical protein FGG79_11890 [Bacillus sp. BHET2]